MDERRSREILGANGRIIPGGLASIDRKTDPNLAFAQARGSPMWDVAGKEYIDYHAGFAPYILGQNDPDQNEAVKAAMDGVLSNYGSGQALALQMACRVLIRLSYNPGIQK